MDEFERIHHFWRPLAQGFPGARNLTDDVAIINTLPDQELVITSDALVEGVHFLPSDPAATIAKKLLRVSLSDLAAKGAIPHAYTLTTAFPSTIDDAWIAEFAQGLQEDQTTYKLHLIGGDSVSTPGPIVLSLTAYGLAPSGKTISRACAKPGDCIYVTGTIGDAFLGLAVLQNKLPQLLESHRLYLIDRYRLPQPRLDHRDIIRQAATAALDISDGLAADLEHLCRASGVGAKINAASIPLSAAVTASGVKLEDLIGGGDDYEILFTTSPDFIPNPNIHTLIGEMIESNNHIVQITNKNGSLLEVNHKGWKHF